MPVTNTGAEAAVLISGGLDSAILLGDYWPAQARVQPLFIRCGLSWESIEEAYLRDYLQALARPNLRPLVVLEQPVADIYGQHWSMTGQDVPAAEAADEAVEVDRSVTAAERDDVSVLQPRTALVRRAELEVPVADHGRVEHIRVHIRR